MRCLGTLLLGLGVLASLGLAAGFLGALHPAGDSLAVIRPGLAALLALLALAALALRAYRLGVSGLVLASLAAGPVIASAIWTPSPPQTVSLTLYAKNLWSGTRDTGPVLADIRAVDPDLVLLQEVSDENRGLLRDLSGPYPHQHVCRYSAWNGIAILSRWPLEEPACSVRRTLALARVDAPGGPVWAGSVHMVWPYPHAQAAFLDQAMPLFERMTGRVVLAGDFNMVPWGASIRRIARATGTQRIGRVVSTFDLRGIPLPIDHVLTSGEGTTERRALLGSDHHGIVARIAF